MTRNLDSHGLEYRDDEIFYYRSTQEMLRSGDFFSPTYFEESRFQKPILFYWLILLSYKIFGVNWTGARCVAAFFGSLSVCLTWLMARDLFRYRGIAHLSALILMTIPLFFRHARNAVPDMALNFFIVAAMYGAILFVKDPQKEKWSILFFVSCALGFMVKGPAALIVPFFSLLMYALMQGKAPVMRSLRLGRGLLMMAVFICPWFFYMIATHGRPYVDYMLMEETRNRLLAPGGAPFSAREFLRMFAGHAVFYVRTLWSYFAPWSLLFFAAIFLARPWRQRLDSHQSWLAVWFGVVFLFFSSMHFVINHYMLVLTTPFAILLSYFLVGEGEGTAGLAGREPAMPEGGMEKIWGWAKKFLIGLMITAGMGALSFVFVFLTGASRWWLVPSGLLWAGMIFFIGKSRMPAAAPLLLGVFLLCVLIQSPVLGKGGLTAHAVLQKFAAAISAQERADPGFVIGVGSHDIHEKELQVYFETKVEKVASSNAEEMRSMLYGFFDQHAKAYCLITEKDFHGYLKSEEMGHFEIVHDGYIMRRRMRIDKAFFIALLSGNQRKVQDYFMERLMLVRKDRNA